jgi:hypothetical protein
VRSYLDLGIFRRWGRLGNSYEEISDATQNLSKAGDRTRVYCV